LAQMAEASS